MLLHGNFSREEWQNAPVYAAPEVAEGRLIPIDLAWLVRMAQAEENKSTFRLRDSGILSMAPLYMGESPAAFYKVVAKGPIVANEFVPAKNETLLVVEGTLTIARQEETRRGSDLVERMHIEGEVVNLSGEPVMLGVRAAARPAKALAVAIYGDADLQPGHRDIPLLGSY